MFPTYSSRTEIRNRPNVSSPNQLHVIDCCKKTTRYNVNKTIFSLFIITIYWLLLTDLDRTDSLYYGIKILSFGIWNHEVNETVKWTITLNFISYLSVEFAVIIVLLF